jgi:hypothetical protein
MTSRIVAGPRRRYSPASLVLVRTALKRLSCVGETRIARASSDRRRPIWRSCTPDRPRTHERLAKLSCGVSAPDRSAPTLSGLRSNLNRLERCNSYSIAPLRPTGEWPHSLTLIMRSLMVPREPSTGTGPPKQARSGPPTAHAAGLATLVLNVAVQAPEAGGYHHHRRPRSTRCDRVPSADTPRQADALDTAIVATEATTRLACIGAGSGQGPATGAYEHRRLSTVQLGNLRGRDILDAATS